MHGFTPNTGTGFSFELLFRRSSIADARGVMILWASRTGLVLSSLVARRPGAAVTPQRRLSLLLLLLGEGKGGGGGVGLVAAQHVFADRAALLTARDAWCANSTAAAATYGPINTWDVSAVTSSGFASSWGGINLCPQPPPSPPPKGMGIEQAARRLDETTRCTRGLHGDCGTDIDAHLKRIRLTITICIASAAGLVVVLIIVAWAWAREEARRLGGGVGPSEAERESIRM